jgi:CheY-like chemotaxis protein
MPETPDTSEALHEINNAAERAAKLTAQMLMFSRKKRTQRHDLNLNELIAQIGNMLRRMLGEKIVLKVQCSETPLAVHADPVMIEQVVLNLAVNARDAMPEGGQLLIRTAETEIKEADAGLNVKARPGRFACLSVTDTGGGITPEAMPHLFEPFFTTKEIGKGTGLGLATVYGIAQQHEGWIEVESKPGCGAKFEIFLPINPKKENLAGEAPPNTELPRGSETILLVEDEPVVRRLARTILQRHGYRVFEAASGLKSISVWNEHAAEIDLLLTDMVMPDGLSGRELANKLQAEKPSLKVIFTTGYSLDAISPDAPLDEGVNFMAKPYTLEKLVQTVRRKLNEIAPQTNQAGSAIKS